MKTNLTRHFWTWFKKHQAEYLHLKNKKKRQVIYWLNELNAHLRAYNKFLGYTLEWRRDKTARLVITVCGRARHFNKTESLVRAAPRIAGWTFSALEEPRALEFLLEHQIIETGIDPRELRFSFSGDDPENTALIIYHPLCTMDNKDQIYELATAAVYNLLGERSFGTDISCLQVENLSAADPGEVEELEALPTCIGMRKSGVMIDSEGKLVSCDL